jgi:hypothetical protein
LKHSKESSLRYRELFYFYAVLERLYKAGNLLNVDVAAGAVVTSLFYFNILGVPPRIFGMLTLGSVVWIIYTLDRLLDVRRIGITPSSERHRFHQLYERPLWIALALVSLFVISQFYFLRPPVIVSGLYVAFAVGAYLFLQQFLRVKEIFVAILYTSGVLVPSLSIHVGQLSVYQYLLIAQLFLVALINLLLFSWFEFEADQKDRQTSFATQWGKAKTAKLIVALCIFNALFSILIVNQYQATWVIIVLPLMTISLLCIYLNSKFFHEFDRYRLFGDAVFFLPLIGLL